RSHRLFLSCTSDNSDEVISYLVSALDSDNIDDQKQAATEICLLAKNKPDNRTRIARAEAIKSLISIISSNYPQLQEYDITAILNLSLCDGKKEEIAYSGKIKPLVRALRSTAATAAARENATCALLRLSQVKEDKVAVGGNPTAGGPPGRRWAPGEEGRVHGALLAVLGEGEQGEGGAGGDHAAASGDDVGSGVEHGGQGGVCVSGQNPQKSPKIGSKLNLVSTYVAF
ncbi:U-box domain-containing protein 4, partial [Phtheirospermum japonicum]